MPPYKIRVDGQARGGEADCRRERHLYVNPEVLRLRNRMPVPEVAKQLVYTKCGIGFR
jgi:hypothetical protein